MIFKKGSLITESYKEYKHKHAPKHIQYVDEKMYKKIINSFFKKLIERLISKGVRIKMPSRLGAFQCMQQKNKKKKVDYYNTNKIYGEHNKKNPGDKKIIYHNNIITNGFIPIFHWHKYNDANFKNKRKWHLKLSRNNVRPNKYNKNNPTYSLIPFFQNEGYKFYTIYNTYLNKYINEQSKKS